MDAKTYVVTGATSGIGKEIARALVRSGGHVGIVGRSPAKLEATRDELRAERSGAEVDVFLADLSLLADVRKVADDIHERYTAIDVLVNNAGMQALAHSTTPEGFDTMLATNYLGPFLLTNLLLDLVEAAPAGRVVVTASEAHRNGGRVDVELLGAPDIYEGLSVLRAYGNTKLLDVLFTQELARRIGTTGVTANCFCPGMVATDLLRDSRWVMAACRVLVKTPFLRTPEQGARMGVRLATDASFTGVTGGFFTSTPGARLLPTTRPRKDADLQRRLWDRTAELVGIASHAVA